MTYLIMLVLLVTALFLILLVMVQRGKGGGLAGALGGMGGQSAFGTKAGDLFTRVTIGVAAFWIILCTLTVKYLGKTSDILQTGKTKASAPLNPGSKPTEGGTTTTSAKPVEAPSPTAPPKSGETGGATPAATPAPASTGSPAPSGAKPAPAK